MPEHVLDPYLAPFAVVDEKFTLTSAQRPERDAPLISYLTSLVSG